MLPVPTIGLASPRDLFFRLDVKNHAIQPEACPRCQGQDIWPEIGPGPYGLYCRGCHWGGPRVATEDDDPAPALSAWNHEARQIARAREMGLKLNLVQPKGDADETQ